MTLPAPHWANPSFRLIEGDRTVAWSDLAAFAARLAPTLPPEGRVAVDGRSVATVIGALIAAELARVELVLLRRGLPRTADAHYLIEPDGRLSKLGPPVHTARDFAVLMPTSGTTGEPKLVRHDFIRLIGRVSGRSVKGGPEVRWLLTYEPTGFGGLQVILSAIAAGGALITAQGADPAALAGVAVTHGATHVSATPSCWRTLLMALPDPPPPFHVVTLGGEAADQPLLDRLAARFPAAHLGHLYASTEGGALFLVRDGKAGFPADWLENGIDGIRLRIRAGVLEVRSPRAMIDYVNRNEQPFTDDGWVITGDLVELAGDRVLFVGRSDGMVNVGGVKVNPQRVEQVLLEVPGVLDATVVAVANPVTGQLLTAAVVPAAGIDTEALKVSIHHHTATRLQPAERPRAIDCVPCLPVAASGKKLRSTPGGMRLG